MNLTEKIIALYPTLDYEDQISPERGMSDALDQVLKIIEEEPKWFVHNHGFEGPCREYTVNGRLLGQCLLPVSLGQIEDAIKPWCEYMSEGLAKQYKITDNLRGLEMSQTLFNSILSYIRPLFE